MTLIFSIYLVIVSYAYLCGALIYIEIKIIYYQKNNYTIAPKMMPISVNVLINVKIKLK